MSSRQGPSRTTAAAASNIRRNLFHSNRRPAAAAPSASSTSSGTTLHAEQEHGGSDLVARDEHGNYQLDQPSVTPLPRDEAQEEHEAGSRLIELYASQQNQHIESNELKASLHASLHAKVASLDDDKWMLEPDDPKPS